MLECVIWNRLWGWEVGIIGTGLCPVPTLVSVVLNLQVLFLDSGFQAMIKLDFMVKLMMDLGDIGYVDEKLAQDWVQWLSLVIVEPLGSATK